MKQTAVVSAFCWRVKDRRILRGSDFKDSVFFGDEVQFGHTVWAGEMGSSWDYGCVSYDGWFFKYFFASFVGAFEFLLVPMEKLHVIRLPRSFT